MSSNNHKPSLRDLQKKEGGNSFSRSTFGKDKDKDQPAKKKKQHLFRNIAIGVVVVILLAGGALAYKLFALGGKISDSSNKSIFDQIKSIVNSSSVKLKGEDEGRINILLLGIAGDPTHPGANLSDTVMLASVNTKTNQIALLSIPRDLMVKVGGSYVKLNAVHAYAEQKQTGSGPEATMDMVGTITGIRPDYYVRFDFAGFTQTIDDLGGVDVPVPSSYYDPLFKIQFNAGVDHMDGARALFYARSRHAIPSSEATDFRRTARQQQVILAARDKFLSTGGAVNPEVVNKILTNLGNHLKTNLELGDMLHLYNLVKDIPKDSIFNNVVDEINTKLVKGDQVPMGGVLASVLVPTAGIGNYSKIQEFAAHMFDPGFVSENAKVEVQNGTATAGVAAKAAKEITYDVVKTANAKTKDYTKTVIYDYSGGKVPNTLKALEAQFGVSASNLPEKTVKQSASADIVVIVGSDYANKN